jgi:hypothetical protein
MVAEEGTEVDTEADMEADTEVVGVEDMEEDVGRNHVLLKSTEVAGAAAMVAAVSVATEVV